MGHQLLFPGILQWTSTNAVNWRDSGCTRFGLIKYHIRLFLSTVIDILLFGIVDLLFLISRMVVGLLSSHLHSIMTGTSIVLTLIECD